MSDTVPLVYKCQARAWLEASVLAAIAHSYRQRFVDLGYLPKVLAINMNSLAHFAGWLTRQGIALSSIDEQVVRRFIDRHLPRCRCAVRCERGKRKARTALTHLLTFLRERRFIGRVPTEISPGVSVELDAYGRHLRDACGLSEATRQRYAWDVGRFLQWQFGLSPISPRTLRPRDVVDYFGNANEQRPMGEAMRIAGVAISSYLRFRAFCGDDTTRLRAAIPRMAQWRLSRLPKTLHREEVITFLGSFNRQRPTGRRDYAMARCCLDLGLRAAEVARLELDDIDWRAGTLCIRGKNRRKASLPLPQELGKALASYIQDGRPTTTSRMLFLRHYAPRGRSLNASTIRSAMYWNAQRCGLARRIGGTHVLRHTVATRLLERGAALKEIADVLRHQSLQSTTIYTKVDFLSLAAVAMPWAGGAR